MTKVLQFQISRNTEQYLLGDYAWWPVATVDSGWVWLRAIWIVRIGRSRARYYAGRRRAEQVYDLARMLHDAVSSARRGRR